MMEGDFSRAKMIFEQASRVDFSQYPIEEHNPKQFLRVLRRRNLHSTDQELLGS
mgnify:CR=1 FL=1